MQAVRLASAASDPSPPLPSSWPLAPNKQDVQRNLEPKNRDKFTQVQSEKEEPLLLLLLPLLRAPASERSCCCSSLLMGTALAPLPSSVPAPARRT